MKQSNLNHNSGNHISGLSGGVQFFLDLRFLQNSSWQGSIQRLDTGESIHFRSELELLSLIESAVNQYRKKTDEEILRKWTESKKEVEDGKENKTISATRG